MNRASTQRMTSFLESFDQIQKGFGGNGQSRLNAVRQDAFARFSQLGFPTPDDEDWKFTNVAPIAETEFKPAIDGRAQVEARDLEAFLFPGLETYRLVFVNGRYVPRLSSVRELPAGTKVMSLSEALSKERELIESHLARYADYQRDAFSALNTAFIVDGAFVYVPRGVILDKPVHLLYVASSSGGPVLTHPRNLIVAAEETQSTVVEHYVSLTDDVYFSNALTEVVVGENGVLSHYLVEQENMNAFSVSTLRVQQARNSDVTSHSALLGGSLVRNNVHPVLNGEGAHCLINGLFMPGDRQHMDNFMYVEHASPHCDSRQFYNGILDGTARGVFSGRIIVHKDAQKTDAKQTNKNVLLSETAQIDSKPQLEIYADDVKCTHGATIGQVNENAIFYLRSRGVPENEARALLLFGFAGECLERMKLEPVRRYLERSVAQWLSQEKLLTNVR